MPFQHLPFRDSSDVTSMSRVEYKFRKLPTKSMPMHGHIVRKPRVIISSFSTPFHFHFHFILNSIPFPIHFCFISIFLEFHFSWGVSKDSVNCWAEKQYVEGFVCDNIYSNECARVNKRSCSSAPSMGARSQEPFDSSLRCSKRIHCNGDTSDIVPCAWIHFEICSSCSV